MSGTKDGGKLACQTNKQKYGEDFYVRIGVMGGKRGRTGGFACEQKDEKGLTGKQRAEIYGAIGGKKSRRGKVKEDGQLMELR